MSIETPHGAEYEIKNAMLAEEAFNIAFKRCAIEHLAQLARKYRLGSRWHASPDGVRKLVAAIRKK